MLRLCASLWVYPARSAGLSQCDAARSHLLAGRNTKFLADRHGQILEHGDLEAELLGIERGVLDTMRFGDAHHIHATHAGGLQRVGQRLAGGLLGLDLLAGLDTVGIVLDTLKTGICRRILALLEMMLDRSAP